jgi:hypothetical protein
VLSRSSAFSQSSSLSGSRSSRSVASDEDDGRSRSSATDDGSTAEEAEARGRAPRGAERATRGSATLRARVSIRPVANTRGIAARSEVVGARSRSPTRGRARGGAAVAPRAAAPLTSATARRAPRGGAAAAGIMVEKSEVGGVVDRRAPLPAAPPHAAAPAARRAPRGSGAAQSRGPAVHSRAAVGRDDGLSESTMSSSHSSSAHSSSASSLASGRGERVSAAELAAVAAAAADEATAAAVAAAAAAESSRVTLVRDGEDDHVGMDGVGREISADEEVDTESRRALGERAETPSAEDGGAARVDGDARAARARTSTRSRGASGADGTTSAAATAAAVAAAAAAAAAAALAAYDVDAAEVDADGALAARRSARRGLIVEDSEGHGTDGLDLGAALERGAFALPGGASGDFAELAPPRGGVPPFDDSFSALDSLGDFLDGNLRGAEFGGGEGVSELFLGEGGAGLGGEGGAHSDASDDGGAAAGERELESPLLPPARPALRLARTPSLASFARLDTPALELDANSQLSAAVLAEGGTA